MAEHALPPVFQFDDGLPHLDTSCLQRPDAAALAPAGAVPIPHAPRILMLYGSLRTRSYSRLLTLEAARLLTHLGAEVRVFHADGLPLPDGAPDSHPKVAELRAAAAWAEGMVWTSPERHGAMTAVMKAQIDWIPLALGAVRPQPVVGGQGLAGVR
jgi:arsenic resistance protein ArsH